MQFEHPEHPGRRVRLGYCLNVVPAEDLAGVELALDRVAVPLARRFGGTGLFGVGLYLPARAAFELGLPGGAADAFAGRLVDRGLDGFTFNAFPFGGFHSPGLKRGVFAPHWHDPRRREFTLAVASVAERVARRSGSTRGHVSISTHAGGFGPSGRTGAAEALAAVAVDLAELEAESGVRVVLSVEPEPRSAANDTREFGELVAELTTRGAEAASEARGVPPDEARAAVHRHLGLCLDACHAAVEFEAPAMALGAARSARVPLGKLQLSNALRLLDPRANGDARARFLALAEGVYLHQTSARLASGELLRADDLPDVAAQLEGGDGRWLDADEWRCHFHVPVDLAPSPDEVAGVGGGLGTTAQHGAELLALALSNPDTWGLDELHLEVETYTFDVLPRDVRGPGDLVDAMERETHHALAGLAAAGWSRTSDPSPISG